VTALGIRFLGHVSEHARNGQTIEESIDKRCGDPEELPLIVKTGEVGKREYGLLIDPYAQGFEQPFEVQTLENASMGK
jgi:hypothetical protein